MGRAVDVHARQGSFSFLALTVGHRHHGCCRADVLAQLAGHAEGHGEVGVSGGQAVLGDVQAFQLFFFGDPHGAAHHQGDHLEHNRHGYSHPNGHSHNAQSLDAQLVNAAAVEQAAFSVKQAHSQGAPGAVCAVNCHSAYRVVDVELHVQAFHHDHHQDTGHSADDNGAYTRDIGAAGSDGHQACQGGVQTHGHVRLLVLEPGDDHADHGGSSGSQGGGAQNLRHRGNIAGGGAVKAVPAEPQGPEAGCGREWRWKPSYRPAGCTCQCGDPRT